MMKKSNDFMNGFMEKLGANQYGKDNQPNIGPEINNDFINEQIVNYTKLLNSGFIEAATSGR